MLINRHHESIVAIATAPGRGGIGIVRVSGKSLGPLVQLLCGRTLVPRHAHYLAFNAKCGAVIDRGIALYFPAPHSYTGEDVLELQIHGGPAVLQLLLQRCLEAASQLGATALRLARPGEFTERAFLNGKLDLAQAEAVADLIDASTSTAARSAARSLSGEFSHFVAGLQAQLTQLRILVEATLDFPEEDIDFLKKADASGQLLLLQQSVGAALAQACQGSLLREGITVVLAGQPNAGKSALLNALAGAEVAIVSPIAGTTRDKVVQSIAIEGVPLHIVDTAGLRQTQDAVEKLGIERSWAAIEKADVVLFVHELHPETQGQSAANFNAADAEIAHFLTQKTNPKTPVIDVWNKADLNPDAAKKYSAQSSKSSKSSVVISAKTGEGLGVLRQSILHAVGWVAAPEGVFMARERHVQALQAVQAALQRAASQLDSPAPLLDLLAEDLRQAQGKLGEITGTLDSDALLGKIFADFCIGK